MDTGLKGTVAIVTAASKGLGKATAMELAREGARVTICARDARELEATAQEIGAQTGSEVLAVPADVTNSEDIARIVSETVKLFGRLDILVTNAGGPPPGAFTAHADGAWQKAFELNLLSVVRLVRDALPFLKESGRGRIINFSSTSVKQPIEGLVLSNAIRTGVIGLAKTLSSELAPHGITVNNIAPGRISTDRTRQLDQNRASTIGISEEEARAAHEAQIPLGRYGEPQEMAYLAVFLASDKASYITGATIPVDGGLTRSLY